MWEEITAVKPMQRYVSETSFLFPAYMLCSVSNTFLCPLLNQMTHFALAFEVPGGWMSEKESMTLTVLQVHRFHLNSLNV